MKKYLIAAILFAYSAISMAAVGVAVGHHSWAGDGFPNIGPGEQVKIFTCTGKMRGDEAGDCALKKCLKHYKISENRAVKEKIGNTELYARKCSMDGWSARKGYSIIAVGPKGNNNYIMSKALGDPTREKAMEYVKSNNFPIDKATIVLDYYDNDGYGFPSQY